MALKETFKAQALSPEYELAVGIADEAETATISLVDASGVLAGPGLLTIGDTEVIRYESVSTNDLLTCTRGYEGTAQAWDAGTKLVRALTAHDIDAANENFDTHLADYASKFPDNAGAHNSIYRGKYLGDTYTAGQKAAIDAGTFEDLYIGDYWTIGGVNYRIAAFNYYYNTGDTELTDNHATIVPDSSLYNHVMNDTNTTGGGYTGSKMYTEGLDSAKSTIESAFGSANIVSHRKSFSNAVTNGQASGSAWATSKVELMTEFMVFGGIVVGRSVPGTTNRQVGVEKSQLPLFSLRPDIKNINTTYWLRDIVSSTGFAVVTATGFASYVLASNSRGVRPAFSIS